MCHAITNVSMKHTYEVVYDLSVNSCIFILDKLKIKVKMQYNNIIEVHVSPNKLYFMW